MISFNLQLKLLRQIFCGYSKKFSCFRKVLMTDLHFKALEYFSSSHLLLRSLARLLMMIKSIQRVLLLQKKSNLIKKFPYWKTSCCFMLPAGVEGGRKGQITFSQHKNFLVVANHKVESGKLFRSERVGKGNSKVEFSKSLKKILNCITSSINLLLINFFHSNCF